MTRPDSTLADAPAPGRHGEPVSPPGGEPEPKTEYGLLIATFATVFSVVTAAARRQGRVPERVAASDIALGGVATQKVARLVAKDRVASPIRAPFTHEDSGDREVGEKPRGRGLRRAIGELLLCPFCVAQWVAAAYALGLLFAPRVTRLVAAMLATASVSDFLQIAYKAAENRREPA
jgi:hypothetical protein